MKELIKWKGKDGKERMLIVDAEEQFIGGSCYAKDFQEQQIEFYYDDAQTIIDSCDSY